MDLPEDKLYRCYAVALAETRAGGLLVDIEGEEIWLPQKMIDDKSEVYQKGDEGDLVIPLNLAEEKGLV